jgi:hypothetical protein
MFYHLADGISNDALTAAGYDWLAGPGLVRCQTASGPAGAGGVLLGDARLVPADRCRFEPAVQRWEPTGLAGLSVGLWLDAPAPGPEELARTPQLQGHPTELLDGRRWLVPIARGWTEEDGELRWYCALPQRLTRRDGAWQRGDVLARYAPLWAIAERWEQRWAAGVAAAVAADSAAGPDAAERDAAASEFLAVDLSLADAADFAAVALAANYRLTAAEISLLGLFADATPAAVLDAVIDRPTRIAWAKKKYRPAPDSTSTSDGAAGSTPATGPP